MDTHALHENWFQKVVAHSKKKIFCEHVAPLCEPSLHTGSGGIILWRTSSFFTAVLCPYPPHVDNTEMIIEGQRPGQSVLYRCHIGHKFPDGGTVRSCVCGDNYRWTVVVQGCKGNN